MDVLWKCQLDPSFIELKFIFHEQKTYNEWTSCHNEGKKNTVSLHLLQYYLLRQIHYDDKQQYGMNL